LKAPREQRDRARRQKHTGDEHFHWLLPKLSNPQTGSRGSAQCAGAPNIPCIWHHFGVVSVREAAFRPGASFPNPSPEGSALRGAPFTSCRLTVRFSRTELAKQHAVHFAEDRAVLAEERWFGWRQHAGGPEACEDHEHVGGGDPEPDSSSAQARDPTRLLAEMRQTTVAVCVPVQRVPRWPAGD
jgi:hypothetical protein